MEYKYGNFNENGTEFITNKPNTPRAFDNFLWNGAMFSNVQQTGVGYFDYQIGDTEGVQLLTGIGRICDFDVFGREHLMNRLIYIKDQDSGEYWTVNWEPVMHEYEKYECIHGLGYTIIRTTVNKITSKFRIFVPEGNDPVELWTLKITNGSEVKRNLSIFVYNQFQFSFKWGFDSYGDMMYRTSYFNKEMNSIVATKHPHTRPHNYLMGFMTADEEIVAFDGTRDAFVGIYNTLKEPIAVVSGHCTNTQGSADATIGAAQFDIILEDKNVKTISMMLGATGSEENITFLKEKYIGNMESYFCELKENKKLLSKHNCIKTPDLYLNIMINNWVKQATLYGSTWCRWGWNGYRDIVQHGLGVSNLNPDRTREIIIEALKHQYKSGLAIRGWNPVDEKPYSDSALWLVFTLCAYIKESGERDILSEEVTYYDGGKETVLGHIEHALSFLENNKGSHDLILIKYGDWNDSLTAIGKEGRGESVWISIAYAEALRQMADLSMYIEDEDRKNDFELRRKIISDAVNSNAWDGNWYLRCFDDNGMPVGSKTNKDGKIFMEPQCWALIAGIADDERASKLINSCDEMLDTEVGYLLLAPTFTEIDNNIGRISSIEPGIAENGTIYSHTNIWMILGLLKYGMADKAYEIFKKVSPGYIKNAEDIKNNCPPYMYANCYFGPDHKNNKYQMEFTWITGSVAWFNTVILNNMVGARGDFNGIVIQPCLPSDWEEVSVDRYYRGTIYHIEIKNPMHIQAGIVNLKVDSKKILGNTVPIFKDGMDHNVVAIMKKAAK